MVLLLRRLTKKCAQIALGCNRAAHQAALRGATKPNPQLAALTPKVRAFIERSAALCEPDHVHVCDGSDAEAGALLQLMQQQGTIKPLPKYDNCWLTRTDPADVARVESRTFICSEHERDIVPIARTGQKSALGNYISRVDYDKAVAERFPGCMRGRTMYVIPFSMGPVGSPLSKIGVEVTDSPYVVYSMRVMTRMGSKVLEALRKDENFVRCLHAVGRPHNTPGWPCDPARTIILHRPDDSEIISYGSGYGGNSLLGKKCFALRLGSVLAKREGWLAEHMLIVGITDPKGRKRYIAAAFPSACGKTNLAMMTPTLPGYKVECVGDDIAWMKFDDNGVLRAINPENGFFGVAPGTSQSTNPIAMSSIFSNTVFTNVAETHEGGVWWEGMGSPPSSLVDWKGRAWEPGMGNAAHPNSRFCTPANQCPIIDPQWESPEGVPISAILFGGRRPEGVPLVVEARGWEHGVFLGASMRSEATAAAEHAGKVVMHDPFAMRPFFGYNFGEYLQHWLSMPQQNRKMPKIFHVNWFRKDEQGKFLWPGFGENSRVLEWVLRRVDNEDCYKETALGHVPDDGALRTDGLNVNMEELFSVPKEFWLKEAEAIEKYFKEEVGEDLPNEMWEELKNLRKNVNQL